MLLAHDLAECISDDSLPSEDVPAARDREARAYRLLASCATHEGIEYLTESERLFREFTAEVDENARIARDFDRLDNLIQLILFRDQFADADAYEEFYRDLTSSIENTGRPALPRPRHTILLESRAVVVVAMYSSRRADKGAGTRKSS